MGTVYKAVDETLEREVAIKVLNPGLGENGVLKRFRAEAMTLARLNHPNIATLYELIRHDDELLMVMEFVRGETFDKLSERIGPMPLERAACLCAQVLDALGHAHRAGIVHRDLKPANLMLTDSGVVKVMDFGIARMIGTEHLTTDGYMMGTPAYMAPEQVLAPGHRRPRRSLLGRRRLLPAAHRQSAVQGRHGDRDGRRSRSRISRRRFASSVRSCRRGAKRSWTRALAKSPADRFQTAEDFRDCARASTRARAAARDHVDSRGTAVRGVPRDYRTAAPLRRMRR